MDQFSLAGRVAIVTGGGKGIGAGIARALAQAGAAVTLTSRTVSDVEGVAKEIEAAGGRALAHAADVTDHANLPGIVDATVAAFGGIDIIVNTAGGGYHWHAFMDTTVEQLEEGFHFTVATPFRLVQLAVPHLLKSPGASIINIGSVTTSKSLRGHLAYECSKAAVMQLTRSMACDLGPKIRVNCINPGAIETEFIKDMLEKAPGMREKMVENTRMRRNGTPADIANAAVYLASSASSFVTGILLDVTGGSVDESGNRFPDL